MRLPADPIDVLEGSSQHCNQKEQRTHKMQINKFQRHLAHIYNTRNKGNYLSSKRRNINSYIEQS